MAVLKYKNPDTNTWEKLSGLIQLGTDVPVGAICEYAGETMPEDYLQCDGSSLLRTDYPDLFNAIGTTYGSVDSLHFNLPDIKSRTVVGLNSDDSDFNTLGKTGGSKYLQKHSHEMIRSKNTFGAGAYENYQITSASNNSVYKTKESGTGDSGNLQPYITLYYIIKAKTNTYSISKVINNLDSDSSTDSLSANQGRVLNNKIDNLTTVYTGTNITAPTCEGFGKIKKLYGKTEETGEGEKSPNNPYEISCVADDVNLFNIQNKRILNNIMLNSISNKSIIFTSNGTGVNRQVFIECYLPVGTYTVQRQYEVLSGTKTNSSGAVALYLGSTWKKALMSASQESATFTITEANTYRIRLSANDSDTMTDNIKIEFSNVKIQKGEVATEYSPYGEGTVKITSTDGTNTSNKVITCKPLCCLKDSEGNIVAQDYVDFTRQKIVRQCGYLVLNGTEEWVKSSATDFDRFVLYTSYDILDNCESISNLYKTNRGTGWSSNEYKLDNYQNGHRVIVNAGTYGSLTLEQFKANLATNNLIIVFEKGTPIEEDIDTTNSIVQYADETTISNSDNAEMELELTKNKAISSINENIGNLQEKDNDLNDRINEVNTNLNDKINGTTLYSSASGTKGTITLSKSVVNFKKIGIEYKDTRMGITNYVEVIEPNGKMINLLSFQSLTNKYITASAINISGNAITWEFNDRINISNAAIVGDQWNLITKVIGYIY